MSKLCGQRVAVIGNPQSLFPCIMASELRSRGMDAFIVSSGCFHIKETVDGIPVYPGLYFSSPFAKKGYQFLNALLHKSEHYIQRLQAKRIKRIMGEDSGWNLMVSNPLRDALPIARRVKAMNPAFVFGQEVFSYGVATALCKNIPRLLMPWGGDIYRYADTTWMAFLATKWALRHVDLLCPTSVSSTERLMQHFGVPRERIQPISWGVDRKTFSTMDLQTKRMRLEELGINPNKKVIMNVRRFHASWGCEIAMRAYLELAKKRSDVHFVLLGGPGTEEEIQRWQSAVKDAGLLQDFTFLPGKVPLMECALWMALSTIFSSLMTTVDMRSLSILQAAASGSVPVLSDQPEYRNMESKGFRALFADGQNVDKVVKALEYYLDNPNFRESVVRSNLSYISENEDMTCQMDKLLLCAENLTERLSLGKKR